MPTYLTILTTTYLFILTSYLLTFLSLLTTFLPIYLSLLTTHLPTYPIATKLLGGQLLSPSPLPAVTKIHTERCGGGRWVRVLPLPIPTKRTDPKFRGWFFWRARLFLRAEIANARQHRRTCLLLVGPFPCSCSAGTPQCWSCVCADQRPSKLQALYVSEMLQVAGAKQV